MRDKKFIDTNVLVYAYDYANPDKQKQSVAIIDELVEIDGGITSTQVLSEFFVVTTKKLSVPLTINEADKRLQAFMRIWPILEISPMIILEGVRGVTQYSLSFWDSLIWATAKLNQIPVILSEDFNSNQTLEGVTFANPFN